MKKPDDLYKSIGVIAYCLAASATNYAGLVAFMIIRTLPINTARGLSLVEALAVAAVLLSGALSLGLAILELKHVRFIP